MSTTPAFAQFNVGDCPACKKLITGALHIDVTIGSPQLIESDTPRRDVTAVVSAKPSIVGLVVHHDCRMAGERRG